MTVPCSARWGHERVKGRPTPVQGHLCMTALKAPPRPLSSQSWELPRFLPQLVLGAPPIPPPPPPAPGGPGSSSSSPMALAMTGGRLRAWADCLAPGRHGEHTRDPASPSS